MLIKNGNVHDAVNREGYIADLLICDGCPFEISTTIETVVVDGEIVAKN